MLINRYIFTYTYITKYININMFMARKTNSIPQLLNNFSSDIIHYTLFSFAGLNFLPGSHTVDV